MRLLVATFVVLWAGPAFALNLPIRLADGATWTQTIQKTRSDERAGKPPLTATVTTVIRATYRTNGKGPATLTQELVSISAKDIPPEALAVAEGSARALYPLTVEVDEALKPTGVVDWDKFRDRIGQVVNSLSGTPQVRQSVDALIGRMSPGDAANFFKELGLLSLGQGTALDPGAPVSYEDEVPNLFGGPPIKTKGSFELLSHEPARKEAVIAWKQDLDPESARASVAASFAEILAQAAPDKVEALKAQMATTAIERHDSCRYVVDTTTGLATRSECVVALATTARGERAKRTDQWLIEQTLPEPR